MSADFRAVFGDQFDAGTRRLADDTFADDLGSVVVGRVRRRRAVTSVAVGGGSVMALGAVAFAAVNAPFGATTPAAAVATGSPFHCATTLNVEQHTDPALSIEELGYMTAAEAEAAYGLRAVIVDPIVTASEPLVPYVRAVNHEGAGGGLAVGLDPANEDVSEQLGLTGASFVKVRAGVVVAVARQGGSDSADAPQTAWGSVANDGVWVFAINDAFFANCPGVTSTVGADLYAVAASQTWDRQQAGGAPAYVWQKLPAPED